jgi:hypothetical protein
MKARMICLTTVSAVLPGWQKVGARSVDEELAQSLQIPPCHRALIQVEMLRSE